MKRGNGKRPFTVLFDRKKDLRTSLNGMSQEVIHPNKWMNMIASSFSSHKKHDSRRLISEAEHFDFSRTSNESKLALKELLHKLEHGYNTYVAFHILTLAWAKFHLMRLTYNKLFRPSNPNLEEDKKILAIFEKIFNYKEVGENPFILNLLDIDSTLPKTIIVKDVHVCSVAEYLLSILCFKNRAAEALNTTSPTLNKILAKDVSKRTLNKIGPLINNEEAVRNSFSKRLNEEQIVEVLVFLGIRSRQTSTN